MFRLAVGVVMVIAGWLGATPLLAAPTMIRVAHFPNLTHAQALVGRADGRFERAMAPDAEVAWKGFSAGPAAVQALFAGELDLAYLGAGPAVVGFVKSRGEALRVLAGSADGGAALVVRNGSGIRAPADFRGRRVASPQLGNTQDVMLRGWLVAHGMDVMERGGDVRVIPMAGADQLAMFRLGEIDAAWSPEPWAARLVHEAGGRIFLDEREIWMELTGGRFATTLLVAHPKFLAEHPDLAARWVAVHAEVTRWIAAHPDDAKRAANDALKRLTGKRLPDAIMDEAWDRVVFTTDPLQASLEHVARMAFGQGFLGRRTPDLSRIVDGRWLSGVTPVAAERGQP